MVHATTKSASKAEEKYNHLFKIEVERAMWSGQDAQVCGEDKRQNSSNQHPKDSLGFDMRPFEIDHSFITCDRMIPLRDNGRDSLGQERESHDTFQIKQEIESAPPDFLNEDKRLE